MQWRNAFRQQILALTFNDLKRVVDAYLKPENASYGALIQKTNKDQAIALGLVIKEL